MMDAGPRRLAGASGLLGAACVFLGLAAAMAFHGGSYSVFNHFISELGWLKHSPLAWAFGGGVFLGGVLCAPAAWAAGRSLGTKAGNAGAWLGAGAALSGGVVGLVPMDWIIPHTVVALLFFCGWLAAAALFATSLLRNGEGAADRALGILCLGSALTSLAFLAVGAAVVSKLVPNGDLRLFLNVLESYQRPAFWPVAILEWTVLISSGAWCVAASARLLLGSKAL